jgi:uncharacterized protein (DUF885 family)
MLARMRRVLVLALAAACSAPPKPSPLRVDDLPEHFDDLATAVATHLYQADPAEAVSLGLHDYDGKLPDRSAAGLAATITQLQKDLASLQAAEATTPRAKLERDVLIAAVKRNLFQLVDLDAYHTNPMAYSSAINLDDYILRDYAPAVHRAGAVIELCRGLPAYLAQARANLKTPIPRPWIDTALLQARGYLEFADKDVRQQFQLITIPLANQADIDPALDTCKKALGEHAAWLEAQQAQGTQTFALGEAKFLKMLADTQGVETDLVQLQKIADDDLRRNTAAIQDAALAIARDKPVRDTVLAEAEDKPPAGEVLELATEQVTAMRRYLVDNRIVTIPSDELATPRESPPFARWNAAFMNHPGPFEPQPLPSFYYISPPDPKWPQAEQHAYIPPRADLLFTTIHEVWPGHFLQYLHLKRNPSRILQSFCTYSNSEGWAHYAEEMMFDAGAGGRTPQTRIGMLKEALLRNVRFVVTLGEHTHGMTVDAATKLFEDKAFVDPGNARQQAVRGTFDPMFLAYTLGKLMIRKLRTDWQTKTGRSLEEFHDQFLSYGCAPVPVIRRAMLGGDAGAAL